MGVGWRITSEQTLLNFVTHHKCTPALPKPIPANTLAKCIWDLASISFASFTALKPWTTVNYPVIHLQSLQDKSWLARVCTRVFSTLMSWSNENKSCMRVNESWQARVCMRVFLTLMSWSNENKSCMKVNESWQARVCMRVFLTLMSWSNKNKSCMRVDEIWQARGVCMRVFLTLMSWSNENKELHTFSYIFVDSSQCV